LGQAEVGLTLWTNREGGCWNACLASLVGCHPLDVPHEDGDNLDLERQNRWLASHGRRLEPVWPAETWGESYPRRGRWIALLTRSPGVTHAVICEGSEIAHDPGFANGWSGTLWPSELAAARNSSTPLGYRLVEV
jgi:hypothetical protein